MIEAKMIRASTPEKELYWLTKAYPMTRCSGCNRRSRKPFKCCSAHFIYQNDQHMATSPIHGRPVMLPYNKPVDNKR